MTALTAATPVSEAVNGLLQDATFQAAVDGRWFDDIPPNTPRPCGFHEVFSERDRRGLGTGGFPELEIRTHTFSDSGSLVEAQNLNLQIVALLKDAEITGTGYQQAGKIVYRETITLRDAELFGIKVHEVVSVFTCWMEQTA